MLGDIGAFSEDTMIERYRGPRRIRLHGERLAALRQNKNHTLAYVATACGVTRQAVCLWEAERTIPDDRAIELLMALFGSDLAGILDVKTWE